MTPEAEIRHLFYGFTLIIACVRIMAGSAFVFLKRFMHYRILGSKGHISVAVKAKRAHWIRQEILLGRRVRLMACRTLFFAHRGMNICLEEFLFLFFMTGIAEFGLVNLKHFGVFAPVDIMTIFTLEL